MDRRKKVKKLSTREREVLRHVAGGFTSKEIGIKLGLAASTIKVYVAHTRRKLGAKNSAHAVSLGFKEGILRWG